LRRELLVTLAPEQEIHPDRIENSIRLEG